MASAVCGDTSIVWEAYKTASLDIISYLGYGQRAVVSTAATRGDAEHVFTSPALRHNFTVQQSYHV